MFLLDRLNAKMKLPGKSAALPGRDQEIDPGENHFVSGRSLRDIPDSGLQSVYFGLGCFWGAERIFWETEGVFVTAVGYGGGHTKNPTYNEVCTGLTGHNELVKVVFDPKKIDFQSLLKIFWESHDPTQGMRQGNDVGTQYRSGIYTTSAEQLESALASKEQYQSALSAAGRGNITTEIVTAQPFYFAEEYHQQYLAKNPNGYCGIGGTGIACPVGGGVSAG